MKRLSLVIGQLFIIGFISLTSVEATFPGFNIAAKLGLIKLSGKHRYFDLSDGTIDQITPTKIGLLYGGEVGYVFSTGGPTQPIIGVRAMMDLSSAQLTGTLALDGVDEGSMSINRKKSIGAGIVGGILLNPRMAVYLSGTLEYTNYKFLYTNLIYGTSNSESFTKNVRALVPGVGATYLLTPKIYASLEYGFAIISKIDLASNVNAERAYQFRPYEHRLFIKIGLRLFGG